MIARTNVDLISMGSCAIFMRAVSRSTSRSGHRITNLQLYRNQVTSFSNSILKWHSNGYCREHDRHGAEYCLTHCGRDKMTTFWQMIFCIELCWMKMFGLRLKLHWELFLGSNRYVLVQIITLHQQAIQWWPCLLTYICVTYPRWVEGRICTWPWHHPLPWRKLVSIFSYVLLCVDCRSMHQYDLPYPALLFKMCYGNLISIQFSVFLVMR